MFVAPDELDIAVRAYAVPKQASHRAGPKRQASSIGPSAWSLTYDTETTTGPEQQVRIVPWQLRRGAELRRSGVAYDPRSLSDSERSILYARAAVCGWEVCTLAEFNEDIFLGLAYELGVQFVAFNDPFDLSRLAIGHASARGKLMRGGFSLQLSADKRRPRVQVRHLNNREALRRFTAPPRQRTPRGMRRRGVGVPISRGAFVDVKTVGDALTGQSHDLASLARLLGTPHQKMETDEHGEALTSQYLDYAMNDVQVTWECFQALQARYTTFGLTATPLHRIFSEASIGKAHLKQMDIQPWRELQPDCPPEIIGIILSTYYGGRADVHLRRLLTRVLYCDFKSMYPTVCVLMGLWRFVTAERMVWEDLPREELQAFLDRMTLADLQRPETWQRLCVLVQVEPDDDLFPVRAQYEQLFPSAPSADTAGQYTIGLNHLTYRQPLWYTVADCIVAKLMTGKAPRVKRGLQFSPVGVQKGLQPVELMGDPAFRIDPKVDDFYRRLIDLRSQVKARQKTAEAAGDEALAAELDAQQLMLKLIANATSYGIFIELNVAIHDRLQDVTVYGPSGLGFSAWVRNIEEPGRYFHPMLATLITGAARLMLAVGQVRAREVGVDWAYCDTDSLALSRPEGMDDADFVARCRQVFEWFTPLNPYEDEGLLFEIESENYRLDRGKPTKELEELFCWAVSPKRAWLFNIDARGRPVLRRASAHGLGHLMEPYREPDGPRRIPKPAVPLRKLGVKRWQYDLGYRLVDAVLLGHPDQVKLDDLPGFDKPATSRYAATTPHLLGWLGTYNRAKPYREQVRPFGFMNVFQYRARPRDSLQEEASGTTDGDGRQARRRKAAQPVRPVAPFHKDASEAVRHAFNREGERGEPVPVEQLATYREALAQYHLHPEAKYQGADFLDRGSTRPRHIPARSAHHIGKEANRWEEQFFLGIEPDAQIEYGTTPEDIERLTGSILAACRHFTPRVLASSGSVSPSEVSAVLSGRRRPRTETLALLYRAATRLQSAEREHSEQRDAILAAIRRHGQTASVRQFATAAGVHYAHLIEVLGRRRTPSRDMLTRLEAALRAPTGRRLDSGGETRAGADTAMRNTLAADDE